MKTEDERENKVAHLSELLCIFLQVLPDLLTLLDQHLAILFPPVLVVLVLPTVVASEALLQLDTEIIEQRQLAGFVQVAQPSAGNIASQQASKDSLDFIDFKAKKKVWR